MRRPAAVAETVEQRCQPQQTRGVETWNAILEAAAVLFAERGYEQTTTHQIAKQANVSVGALYRYFDGKQAVLIELYRREMSAVRQVAVEEFSIADLLGHDVRQLLHKTLSFAFRIYSARPGLRRVLGEQSRKIPELAALRASLEAELLVAVQGILQNAAGAHLADVEVAAYLVTLFIDNLIDDYVLYRRERSSISEERVITGAVEFILRSVLADRG